MSKKPSSASSPLPIALRRSFQLSSFEVVLLGLGGWLLIGVFSGFDAMASLAAGRAGLAYLLFGLLVIPTLLSHFELGQWIRRSGGSYRLIQGLERPGLTFLAGWAYLLAWAALSALIVGSFSHQAARLIEALTPLRSGPVPLQIGFVLFITLWIASSRRPAWSLGLRFSGLVALGLVALILALAHLETPIAAAPSAPGAGTLFSAVASLGASLWILEIVAERQRRAHAARVSLLGALTGPLLAAGLGFLSAKALAGGSRLETLGEMALPGAGGLVMQAVGALIALLLWHGLSLIMLRQMQAIGGDGVLPGWLLRPTRRGGYPVRLSIFLGALTLVALGLAGAAFSNPLESALGLMSAAAAIFLILQIAVNLSSIFLAPKVWASKPKYRLPMYPIIPTSGAAIMFLLLMALPGWTRALALFWLGLGALAFWQGGRQRMQAAQLGVTVFQDTVHRPSISSAYPVLIPIANPDTAIGLVRLGASFARQQHGHLVLLQVIKVPEHFPLDSARFEAQKRLDLMERLLAEAERYAVQVEGITRLSRSIPQGILETVAEESVKLVVMGSQTRPQLGSSGFGAIVDRVLEGAACQLAVVSGDGELTVGQVVVPVSDIAGGRRAARRALALTDLHGGQVKLIHVARAVDGEAGILAGETLLAGVQADLEGKERISTEVLSAGSTLDGILKASRGADLILVGASEQGLLEQEHFGRLPLLLAMRADVPLMLMRSQAALPAFVARRAWRSLADLLPRLSLEEQMAVYRRMHLAVRPSVSYFVLITLSAVIAGLGLLLDSPAVVIGAMLVAPLMSPIVAAAVGITFGELRMLRDSLTAALQGAVVAIFIATLVTLIVPGAEATEEVMARAQPTLIDLIVALASGMAGAFAIAHKEVGEALPGVAIAAALLPPLASVGVGIALGEASIAAGALLLFATNLIAIVFASAVVFLLLGVRPPRVEEREVQLRQGLVISVVSLLLVSLPLGYFLWRTVDRDRLESRAQAIVERHAEDWGAERLADFEMDRREGQVDISGTLYTTRPVSEEALDHLRQDLSRALRTEVDMHLFIIQGAGIEASGP